MPFIIACYAPDHDKGKLSVRFERDYPCDKATSTETCHLVIKAYRPRKTGPSFPLVVCYCKVHKSSFTVYPEGYSPHGRKSLLSIDAENSIWQSMFDANDGKLWPENPPMPATRTSQMRYLHKITRIFGFDQPVSLRNQVAYIFEVELAQFEKIYSKVRDGPRNRQRWGTWLQELFAQIPKKPDPIGKFLRAGALVGLWPKPTRWLNPSCSH